MADQKKKLSDVERDSTFVFRKEASSFAEAYPTIKSLRVEVTEKMIASPAKPTHVYTERTFRHTVDCSNPACYSGGVTIGFEIHNMVAKDETEREWIAPCEGYEGNSQKRTRSCATLFTIRATIVYRDEFSEAEQNEVGDDQADGPTPTHE